MEKRRYWLVASVIVIAMLFSVLSLVSSFAVYIDTAAPLKQGTVIVIDAGHGDFDPGAVVDGVEEKWINLSISLALRDYFESAGYTVVMTRNDDNTLADTSASGTAEKKRTDTHNRVKTVDSFDDSVLISIHQNAYRDVAQHGTQVFFGTLNEQSELLASCIQDSVRENIQPENQREIKQGTDSIYLLTNTKAPTVLVECGFMTNDEERADLLDEEYQRSIAYSIYLGYTEYEKLKET